MAIGAGPIERVEGGQILEAVGLVAPQNVAHARRFKLEHAAGKTAREDRVVSLLVVERKDLRRLIAHRGTSG
jgi:hypothetical protein